MTNFIKMPPIANEVKEEPKKTVFTHLVMSEDGFLIKETNITTEDFDNVMHLWTDVYYGDVFRCWDVEPDNCFILFGKAGDEFQ